MNDLDRDRVRELIEKLRAIRLAQGANSHDHAYWSGYLAAYSDQNAITDEEVGGIWAEVNEVSA